jgi:lysophospholipase L1-like esterase
MEPRITQMGTSRTELCLNLRKSAQTAVAQLCFLCVLCLSVSHSSFAQTTTIDGSGVVTNGYTKSISLPEGNYTVTVRLGDANADATTTVKAEQRRLMLEQVHTAAGEFVTRTFTVNVRTPKIAGDGEIKLKSREHGYPNWDDQLTLEFDGDHPAVRSIEIAPAPSDTVTVFIAGDSTVTDQEKEPYNSWGQMLPRFFKPRVAVANYAESGETLRSFIGAHRLDKILSVIKPGDYLFIQFGHNDMKEKGEGVGAFTTYKASLEQMIDAANEKGATPVLLTPMNRRSFDSSGHITNTHGDYPDAVRQTAQERGVTLIDLHAMTKPLYEAWGPEQSERAFAPKDKTHHNNYGSYELARCVVEGIRTSKLDLAKLLADDVKPFDPSKPDPIESFAVPASPHDRAVDETGRLLSSRKHQ